MQDFVDRWHLVLAAQSLVIGLIGGLLELRFGRRSVASDDVVRSAPSMVVLAFVGLWATIPDTELPLFVGLVSGPMLLLRWRRRVDLVGAERFAAAALILFVSWVGTVGRWSAWFGAVCCALVPGIVLARSGRYQFGRQWSACTAFGMHAVAVLAGSRLVAHLDPVPSGAMASIVVAGVAGYAVLSR